MKKTIMTKQTQLMKPPTHKCSLTVDAQKRRTETVWSVIYIVNPRYNDRICSKRFCHQNEFAVVKYA